MIDLQGLIEQDVTLKRVATTGGGEWAGPCPFCGEGRDRFRVWPVRNRYWCRVCGKAGDTIQYLRDAHHLAFAEAKARVDGKDLSPTNWGTDYRPLRRAEPKRPVGPPSDGWQARGRVFGAASKLRLWSAAGKGALVYLKARGLKDDTLASASIGYNPQDCFETLAKWGLPEEANPNTGKSRKVLLPRGIVIPCEVGGALWYLKIRRVPGEPFSCFSCKRPVTNPGEDCPHCGAHNPKYLQVRGGRPALYGAHTLTGKRVGVICEGELDALLLAQEVGAMVGAVTLGSASNRGATDLGYFADYLLPVQRLLLAFDLDASGASASTALANLTRRARRVTIPAIRSGDKDITDFHKASGKLRDWLAFVLAQIENAWPVLSVQSSNLDTVAAVLGASREVAAHPIYQESAEVEEAWWARVFAERGLTLAEFDTLSDKSFQ